MQFPLQHTAVSYLLRFKIYGPERVTNMGPKIGQDRETFALDGSVKHKKKKQRKQPCQDNNGENPVGNELMSRVMKNVGFFD